MQMFECPRCSCQNDIGQRFCGACGQRFQYDCPRCHGIVDPASRFCPNCGVQLGWGIPQHTGPLLVDRRMTYQQKAATDKVKWQCLTCAYVFDGLPPVKRKRKVVCPRCRSSYVYPGSEDKTWALIAKEIRKRDNYQCQRCGESDQRTLVVHHIRPVSDRGTSEPSNLITLCIDCHNKVHWGLGYYLVYPFIWIARRLGAYGRKERFKPISKEQTVRTLKRRRSK